MSGALDRPIRTRACFLSGSLTGPGISSTTSTSSPPIPIADRVWRSSSLIGDGTVHTMKILGIATDQGEQMKMPKTFK